MDLRINRVRASLIQKINATEDVEKLGKILDHFDDDVDLRIVPMTKELYLERTLEGMRSAREDRRYTMEEVKKRFGISEK